MEWRDTGIILGTRRHGETSVILEAMTAAHGRHLGLVRGGRSRRMQPVLQPGNRVDLAWRARLDEHLGTYQVEPVSLHAARLMETAVSLNGLQMLAAHLRLLPERDPQPGFFETLAFITDHLHEVPLAGIMLARFEIAVLEELGFGLDLSRCALTGGRENLAYVSPKTGRAVTREAGEPWRDKLLELPGFLLADEFESCDVTELKHAFSLTGFFLHRHVYEPRGLTEPESRTGFISALVRRLEADAVGQGGESAA